MRTEAEIIDLSDNKLLVAEFLLDNGFFDDAYYLGVTHLNLGSKQKFVKLW